jgi:hypothetical protein
MSFASESAEKKAVSEEVVDEKIRLPVTAPPEGPARNNSASDPDATIGILLLAAIPGTPIALQFTRIAKTRLAFAAAMNFVLSLVSIAMTPLAIEVMPQTAQRNGRPLLILITTIALHCHGTVRWSLGGTTSVESCSQTGTTPEPSADGCFPVPYVGDTCSLVLICG